MSVQYQTSPQRFEEVKVFAASYPSGGLWEGMRPRRRSRSSGGEFASQLAGEGVHFRFTTGGAFDRRAQDAAVVDGWRRVQAFSAVRPVCRVGPGGARRHSGQLPDWVAGLQGHVSPGQVERHADDDAQLWPSGCTECSTGHFGHRNHRRRQLSLPETGHGSAWSSRYPSNSSCDLRAGASCTSKPLILSTRRCCDRGQCRARPSGGGSACGQGRAGQRAAAVPDVATEQGAHLEIGFCFFRQKVTDRVFRPIAPHRGSVYTGHWGAGVHLLPGKSDYGLRLTWADPLVSGPNTRRGDPRLLFDVRGAF